MVPTKYTCSEDKYMLAQAFVVRCVSWDTRQTKILLRQDKAAA